MRKDHKINMKEDMKREEKKDPENKTSKDLTEEEEEEETEDALLETLMLMSQETTLQDKNMTDLEVQRYTTQTKNPQVSKLMQENIKETRNLDLIGSSKEVEEDTEAEVAIEVDSMMKKMLTEVEVATEAEVATEVVSMMKKMLTEIEVDTEAEVATEVDLMMMVWKMSKL